MKPHIRLLPLMALAAVTGLAQPATANPNGKRVAVVMNTTKNPFNAALANTIQKEADAKGIKITLHTSPYDAAMQTQQVNDAVAQKFDLIAIHSASERAIIPAMARAKAAGIPVIVFNSPVEAGNEGLYIAYVGEDHTTLGRITGETLGAALKDRKEAKIALLTGVLSEGVPTRRVAGFKEAIAKFPNIKIAAIEDARWDMAMSEQLAGQLFARFAAQGGLDAIYAMADNMAEGVIQAAKAANVPLGNEPGKLTVVSSNCMKFGIEHIRRGEQYATATQMPTRTGKAAVDLMVDYFNGKTLAKDNILPMEPITKANVEQYAAACTF
jgi:ribose transport system substrate-binding protein